MIRVNDTNTRLSDLWKSEIPEGEKGNFRVERFTVTEEEYQVTMMRASMGREYPVIPGQYTRLMYGRTVVMSDTRGEMKDHAAFVYKARGDVLVAGLGLGLVTLALMHRPAVRSITVVEKNQEVIDLVAPHLPRTPMGLEIVHADIFEWKPLRGSRWDYGWFDIWNHKSLNNLKDFTKLKRKYSRHVGVKGFWAEGEIRRVARRRS